jgi:HlyD family secretion protein
MFRKAALAKLSSPEQLDSLLQVTKPKSWVALIACIVLIQAALVWGIFGRTAERVSGAGIMLSEGGVFSVEARGGGTVKEVKVKVGDAVKEGDIVAVVAQNTASEEIRQNEKLLADLRANRQRAGGLTSRNRDAELSSVQEDRQRLAKEEQTVRAQVKFLEDRLKAQQEAARSGLITNDQVQSTSQQLEQARSALIANQAQVTQTRAREASIVNTADTSSFNLDQEIQRTEHQLELSKLRYSEGTEIKASHSGKVVSRLVDPGQEVLPGKPVLYIELTNQPLQAVAFIPQGPRITPRKGEKPIIVQMSPEGIAWEEYGYMLGEVEHVNQTPANPDDMIRLLRNQALITQFTATTGVYEVRVKPLLDSKTPSGFKWTSREGPPLKFESGTLLRVQVPVDEKRPISLVIPTVRKWLGI